MQKIQNMNAWTQNLLILIETIIIPKLKWCASRIIPVILNDEEVMIPLSQNEQPEKG